MLSWVLSHPRLRSVVVEAAIAWFVFWADPLGIVEQRLRAVDNFLGAVTQYSRIAPPERLAVVLIDRDALNDWRLDWPIPYSKMAEMVHELACAGATGVFFDFTASRQFNLAPAEDQEKLREAVEDSSRGPVCLDGEPPQKIPVFFGKIEQAESPLNTWLEQRDASFFLNAGEEDGIYQTGKEKFPARFVADKDVSPAFGLMRVPRLGGGLSASQDAAPCRDEDARPQCWRAPLALVWNGGIDPRQGEGSNILGCRGDKGWIGILWGLTPWGASDRYEPCPPVLTRRALDLERDLGYIEKYGDPAISLKDRFVLVGVELPGLNDRVLTPVHDHLPGVYKHAVALGALLHWGADYPTLPPPTSLGVLVAATYLILEAAREGVRGRKREHWLFTGIFVVFAGAFAVWVYRRNWPASLVVAVFGYYAAVAAGLFFASRARSQANAGTAPAASAGARGKGRKP